MYMKRFLLFLFLIGLGLGFSKMKAQSYRDTGTFTQKSDDGVLVAYPNPARDYIVVKSKDVSLKVRTVTFFSIIGMQVAEFNLNSNSTELRLDKLKPGKYLMKYVLSDGTQKVTQIVKQ